MPAKKTAARKWDKEQELSVLHRVAQDIASNLTLKEFLERTVKTVTEVTEADTCFIYLYNKPHDELVLSATSNPKKKLLGTIKLKMGEGVTGWVAQAKKPVALEREAYKDPRFRHFTVLPEDRYEAFLAVPILVRDEIVGVMNFHHKKEHVFPQEQIDLLFTTSKYLGSAIDTAVANEEVHRKAKQLDLLSEISRTIVSSHYLNEILQLIVTMTAGVMASKVCSIMLLDEKKQELVIAATQSLSQEYVSKPNLKVGQSIGGRVVKEKRPITVLDVRSEPGYMFPEIARREGIVSMLSVPMMIKDRVVGVINSYTPREHVFTREEVAILQAVANQAAVAIENTRLDQEILNAKEALETRKVVERAKGVLMKELAINEDEAYRKIHRKSMDLRKSMKEVAEAIIVASDIRR